VRSPGLVAEAGGLTCSSRGLFGPVVGPSSCTVKPFTVLWPAAVRMASAVAPRAVVLLTLMVTDRSFQATIDVLTAPWEPVSDTEPRAAPKPTPVIVIRRLASLLRRYGRETANSAGASAAGLQSTGLIWVLPGAA
jgi:hypothetical protein